MYEVGGAGIDTLGIGNGLFEVLVRWMGFLAECTDDEDVEVVEFGVFFFGDKGYIGKVCHATNAVACDGEFAMHYAYWCDFYAVYVEWGIDVDFVHYDAWYAWVERFAKAVGDACAYGCGYVWFGIDVDVAESAEWA